MDGILQSIKTARVAKGITQEEMAHLLGYRDKSSYNQIENGATRLTLDAYIKISRYLDLPAELVK